MTGYRNNVRPVSDICTHVKHLGYATSRRIRLYGEEFEVVSDPFPEAGGIAVHVTTKKDSTIRVLQIPVTVLQSAKRQKPRERWSRTSRIRVAILACRVSWGTVMRPKS
jgi:hypothetical protein